MQVSTELKPLFSFSSFYIILFLIIIIILVILYFFPHRKKKIPKVVIPKKNNQVEIKQRYLQEINELENSVNNRQISNRKAYQQLSSLIRLYIFEMTSIKVQNYTLSEIEQINMPILLELVREYYVPEFASISTGDILAAIQKTREVIVKWN